MPSNKRRVLSLFPIWLSLFCVSAQATQPTILPNKEENSWALGVGFGTEANYRSVSAIELKAPTLFWIGSSQVTLVLSVESKTLASSSEQDILPIHLMVDLTQPIFRNLARTYIRLGGGTTLVNDSVLLPGQDQFFNLQAQVGGELLVAQGADNSYGALFVQAMLNAAAIRQPPLAGADIYSGTSLLLGLRTYF